MVWWNEVLFKDKNRAVSKLIQEQPWLKNFEGYWGAEHAIALSLKYDKGNKQRNPHERGMS